MTQSIMTSLDDQGGGAVGADRWAGEPVVGLLLVVDSRGIRAEPLFEHTAFARVVLFDGSEPPFDECVDGHAVTRLYVWAILEQAQQFLQRLDKTGQLFTFTHRPGPSPRLVLGSVSHTMRDGVQSPQHLWLHHVEQVGGHGMRIAVVVELDHDRTVGPR
jgi:hypothetical protein